jgi:hypothetical protein
MRLRWPHFGQVSTKPRSSGSIERSHKKVMRHYQKFRVCSDRLLPLLQDGSFRHRTDSPAGKSRESHDRVATGRSATRRLHDIGGRMIAPRFLQVQHRFMPLLSCCCRLGQEQMF